MTAFQDTVAREQPQHQRAGRGWGWIADGWSLFKQMPGTWLGIFVIWIVVQMAANLVPLGGLIMGVLGPVFTAGILFAARDQEAELPIGIGHLFAGFKHERFGQLALLGFLTLLMFLLVMLIVLMVFALMLGGIQLDPANMPTQQLLVGMLLVLVLLLPVIMAVWFSTSLVALHDLSPIAAFKLSFAACLRNIGSLTVFSLALIPLGLLALIPFGLGLLILAPVAVLAMYRAYVDIFRVATADAGIPDLG